MTTVYWLLIFWYCIEYLTQEIADSVFCECVSNKIFYIINMPGRKSDPIWTKFEKIATVSGKGCKARCKLCKKEMQGLVARLQAHWDKCSSGNVLFALLHCVLLLLLSAYYFCFLRWSLGFLACWQSLQIVILVILEITDVIVKRITLWLQVKLGNTNLCQ